MKQRFKYRVQLPNETVQMFLSELRVLATGCGFTDADDMILGQFVSGISDQQVKNHFYILATMNQLTLQNAIDYATFNEATKRAQTTGQQPSTTKEYQKPPEPWKCKGASVSRDPRCSRCTSSTHPANMCPYKTAICAIIVRDMGTLKELA
jgi:hypothetical protein